jgi:hypothetical protein
MKSKLSSENLIIIVMSHNKFPTEGVAQCKHEVWWLTQLTRFGLPAESAQVGLAVGTGVMDVHAFINTAGNQTAAQPTSVKYNTHVRSGRFSNISH